MQVDTNYKPTRTSEHPVELTRPDAVRLSASVLAAVEDTFHATRVGELHAGEAAELFEALEDLDCALAGLRAHALSDLLRRVGLDEHTTTVDPQPEKEQ